MSTVNLQHYVKVATGRLRSQAHSQSFAHSVHERKRRALTPSTKLVWQKLEDLQALTRLHQRTYDPALKRKGLQMFQGLSLPVSTDEDPHFILTTRALRLASYVDAVKEPLTFSLLNHCTRHSFLLDGYSLMKLAQALRALQHPNTVDALRILLPRFELVSEELTPIEAAKILEIFHFFSMQKHADLSTLQAKYAKRLIATIASLSVEDMQRCLQAVPLLTPALGGEVMLEVAPSLSAHLRAARQLHAAVRLAEKERSTPAAATTEAAASDAGEGVAPLPAKDNSDSRKVLYEEQYALLQQHVELHRAAVKALQHCALASREYASIRHLLNELTRSVFDLSVAYGSIDALGSTGFHAFMRREDICQHARLLDRCSYRNIPALRQCTGRYLTASCSRAVLQALPPAELAFTELTELGMVVEALGRFSVCLVTEAPQSSGKGDNVGEWKKTGTMEALALMVGESSEVFMRRIGATSRDSESAFWLRSVACIARQWKSLVELHAALPTAHRSAAILFAQTFVEALRWSWASDESPILRYTRTAACHQDSVRTARLLRRLAELSVVLEPGFIEELKKDQDVIKEAMRGLLVGLQHYGKHYRRGSAAGAGMSLVDEASVKEDIDLVMKASAGWDSELKALLMEVKQFFS